MKYYIGIDIGTSSVKLTCIDENAKVAGESSREYKIEEPKSGWKEIDPEKWIKGMEEAFAELFKTIDSKKVEAIGVTGQMHTVIFVDREGKSIRPALMWNDTRTANLIPKLRKKIQMINEVSYISNIISTGSPAANLFWLSQYEEENFAKIHKFLIGPDYIAYRLTGKIQTDYCEASTSSLCDLKTGRWSEEIRRLFKFPRDIYPEIKGTCEVCGIVTKQWQEKFHFKQDVKVLTGTGDNPAAAIATGCFAKGYPVLSLGTSGVLMYPKKKINFEVKGKNILFSMDGKDVLILVQGVVQSTGSSLAWWVKNTLQADDFMEETTGVDLKHLGENELMFYPHLVGDKTIYQDPELRGSFVGIGTDTTRKEMTIAVMEGIAFAVKQLVSVMGVSKEELARLKVTGGGSKNEVWMQILADVLNTKVEQLESGAGAGYGIALCAAAAGDEDLSMNDLIEQTVSIKNTFIPRQYNRELYEQKYQKYLRVYDALKHIYQE